MDPASESGSEKGKASPVTQGSILCAPFHTMLPQLSTPEGDFIPIRAVCEMVHLAPATWIGLICRRHTSERYPGALRRLPWHTDAGVLRTDWCLKRINVSTWFMRLDPRHLHGEQRDQLDAYQRELMEAADTLLERQRADFAAAKRDVYEQLQACEQSQQAIASVQAHVHEHLPHMKEADEVEQDLARFDQIVARGQALYDAYANALRRVLKAMLEEPVGDAYLVRKGVIEEAVVTPLLPGIPDMEEVNACREQTAVWMRNEFVVWCEAQGAKVTWKRTSAESEEA